MRVGFEAVYCSIPEVRLPHIIHPEDVGRRLHVPPKTFIPIAHHPTLRHIQNTVILTFATVTSSHIVLAFQIICKFTGSRRGADKIFLLLRYCALSLVVSSTFRGCTMFLSSSSIRPFGQHWETTPTDEEKCPKRK